MTGDESWSVGPLSFVTVFFEAEVDLVELQARSLARFLRPSDVGRIIAIDNSARGLHPARRSRLINAYGKHGQKTAILRSSDVADIPPTSGWISQQILKLLVHPLIQDRHYIVLDAKNHLIRPVSPRDFINPDGRARGASHGYEAHPLRDDLDRILRYLDVDPLPWVSSFPVTHTPFVFETDLVAHLTDAIAARSGRDFASEFIEAGLLEFFLYSGWLVRTFGTTDGHLDGTVVRSTTIWPGRSSAADVDAALSSADKLRSPFLAVHRGAIARAHIRSMRALSEFWLSRGLFDNQLQVMRFLGTSKAAVARSKVRKMINSAVGGTGRVKAV